MTTPKKTMRRGISRAKEDGRWTKWFCDDAVKYPAPPENASNPRNREWCEWVNECLRIAGLYWEAYYRGAGQPFAHEPYGWIDPRTNKIQIRQNGGLDV